MSDIRKWLTIMESIPPVISTAPEGVGRGFKRDATVTINPRAGGGVGRFMDYTNEGNAMIDIKGVAREIAKDDFSIPQRDLENGNDWFHMSVTPDSAGTSNDKPEFRPGDMVKIADVYGSVIGPGFGVFVGYGTTGRDCIVLFDGKQIVVPIENVASVVEQNAKDNFDAMDNDGNLSPMSLGSENVKIEQPATGMSVQEPAMDHRDEFSKWMDTVEEAMSAEGKVEIAEDFPINECGCGSWDCPICFPDDSQMSSPELGAEIVGMGGEEQACPTCGHVHNDQEEHGELEGDPFGQEQEFEIEFEDGSGGGMGTGGMAVGEDDDAVAAFTAAGGKPTVGKYHGPRKSEVTFPGSAHIGGPGDPMRASRTGMAANTQGLPVVGMKKKKMEEEPMEFEEKPKSGKGVKLGDIVHKTEFRKTGGQNSPMTYGDDNLDEEQPDFSGDYDDDYSDLGKYEPTERDMADYHQGMQNDLSMSPDERLSIVDKISNMQDLGISKADQTYQAEQLAQLEAPQLKQILSQVMGEVSEAKPTDTKTKTTNPHGMDDWDDILNPKQGNLPANVEPEGFDDDGEGGNAPAATLPTASRASTQAAMANRNDSVGMRDMMNRINPLAGEGEPDIPQQPQNELTIRTARDVPAVISQAMQAAGTQSPEWHTINNLPGYNQRNVRGMGRNIFSMFTSTPLENIKTIANVDGQGPNSDAEINAVAAFLRDNAEDLGSVDVSHGMAIPGYRPDVKEYRANGIRFQIVRDPMGRYIYAYPDADARIQGPDQGQGQLPGGRPMPGNPPRLRESKRDALMALTLFEELKLDEEIKEAFARLALTESMEITESSLSKLLGKKKGGQKLVSWLHKKHKLSNEADLEPVAFNKELLWSEFKSHPDDFVIVSGDGGSAGIKPSQKHIEAMKAQKAKKGESYNPGRDSTLPYQVIAFTDDGQQVDPALLRPTAEPGKEPDERDPDPTIQKARMGKSIGKDLQNQNNTFSLLNDQIGPIRTVWISGFAGYRGDPDSIRPATGSVERDKMKKRDELGAGPNRQKAATVMNKDEAIANIFKRLRPVLQPIVAKAYSKVSLALQDAVKEDHQGDIERLAAVRKAINEFKQAIDTSGDIPMTGAVATLMNKAFAAALKTPSYSPEYASGLSDLAKGNSVGLAPVVQSLRKSLIGAIR
jgi:hypothetical protein